MSASGVAVVFVSHRLAEVLEISSRVTVLRDGKLVGVYPTKGLTQSRITELMTGKTFDHAVRTRDLGDSPVVLEVKGLTRPGEFEDVSFSVRNGETLGVTGLLGAGRTELAMTLFGMRKPKSGTVTLEVEAARLRFQPGCDPCRRRLPVRRPAVAGADPAAIDRRQHGDRLARQDSCRRTDFG